jgi:hypothetical protein
LAEFPKIGQFFQTSGHSGDEANERFMTFWAVVVNVFDEEGEMLPNKVRVMWGRMENFKCVDYFQVFLS